MSLEDFDPQGYGRYNSAAAHRLSYELHKGSIPTGLFVRHLCHNPRCVNPDHLEVGDQKQNIHDSVVVRRHCHGETHGMAKLTEKCVKNIRIRYNNSESAASLSKEYGVCKSTVYMLISRKTWLHI